MAFRGHFDYSLDAKNRLTVPPKFRAPFSEGLVLAQSLDPCIEVWAPPAFESYTGTALAGLNPMSPDYRALSRYYAGHSFDAELDGAGRVMLRPALLTHAGIEREVVVVGNDDHLEVWDRGRWVDHQRELASRASKVAEGLGHPS